MGFALLPSRDVVEQVCFLMKQDYPALGFLPRMAVEEAWHRGEVVLQWDGQNPRSIYGYFLHGPIRTGRMCTPKQMFVDVDVRRYGYAQSAWLVLVDKCLKGGAIGIRFRCAEGLPSNLFWQAMGCRIVATLENTNRGWRHVTGTGRGKLNRLLHVYEYMLQRTFLGPSDWAGLVDPNGKPFTSVE